MIPNILRFQRVTTPLMECVVPLNYKEIQLIQDKTDQTASWNLVCESIKQKVGIDLQSGDYQLLSYTVGGVEKPLH